MTKNEGRKRELTRNPVTIPIRTSFSRKILLDFFSTPPIVTPSIAHTRTHASEKDESDPSGFVGAPWPLKRNSTIARTSTDVFARHVWVDRVGIEVRVRRRYFRRDHALFDVLSDLTHPFLDGDLPAFPDELAYRDHASDPHTAHQHHEHAADVRQSQLVRRRAALRDIVLLAEQRFLVFFFCFFHIFQFLIKNL